MEIWKEIKGFNNYEVSNYGNVRNFKTKYILKQSFNQSYTCVGLSKKGVTNIKYIHKLVAIAFLNHVPCGHKLVVNHIDFDKRNNNLDNLEIITQRENANKKHIESSSKYVGVCFNKKRNKWRSAIIIEKERVTIGFYNTEIEAHNAYQQILKNII